MKQLLKSLKLICNFKIEIEIEKSIFVDKLKSNVDVGDTGLFLATFEAFSSSTNHYKGYVGYEGFKIRRRKKFFDMNTIPAIASGVYSQKDQILEIDTEVNGFHNIFLLIFIFIPLVYIFFIIGILSAENVGEIWFVFPFMILHGIFMLGIPYFIMRRGVSKLKYELERDFFYIAKK